ncbi:unnamed protein product, partial [Laminaria digitata]
MREEHTQIAIVGAGPAGLSIASALAARSLEVMMLTPAAPAPWVPNYGLWRDEIAHDAELERAIARSWASPHVWTRDASPRVLDREYVLLDNPRTQNILRDRLLRHGGHVIEGLATSLAHTTRESILTVSRGDERFRIIADLVIDATGHAPRFVTRAGRDTPGVQIAHGLHATLSKESAPLEQMRLMDFRPAGAGARVARAPTFLYAMPLDDTGHEIFVEETSLVARPAMREEECERRLHARLEREGLILEKIHAREHCAIPMGHALPDLTQRVVGFGGAASMVHPATGYQISRALGWARGVASAIALAHGERGERGESLARAAWESIWTPERRRRRRLYMYGLTVLVELDQAGVEDFFEAFFAREERLWRGYLAGTLAVRERAGLMW